MTQERGDRPSRTRRAMDTAAHAVRSLGDVRPHPHRRWPLGLQAAIAVAGPILIGNAAGHAEIGFQAALGAFALLYFGSAKHVDRARTVPLIGSVLLLCAALGAAAGGSAVATAVGLISIAVAAGLLTQVFDVGPPGPIFFVLVFGSSAHITMATDGVRHVDPVSFVGAVASGVAFASLIAAAPLALSRHRVTATPLRTLVPGPSWSVDGLTVAIRVAAVALTGTILSVAIVDPDRAYWTVCAGVAVVAMRAPRRAVASRGLHRVVGTVTGALLFAGLAQLSLSTVALALVLGVLQFTIELLVVRHYALALTFITPLVLLLVTSAGGTAGSTVAPERVIDTLVGATLGVLAALIPAPRRAGNAAPR
ncbi:FUSC family protein [Demequina zhanjiangensis]|uniref:FUSC family protein n=1 Tax=Demequina zhanjiangensis TaxID=3051659 RepID=A0ABT8G4C3_9MICO|nr:FUSC family protein [Demequina sp. SYSU T00b26]MDN4473995.1 FUSC family protein [Demequina sp. SYSU T00b26]